MSKSSIVAVIRQQGCLLAFLGSIGIVVAALAYEWITGLLPCPLCWLQRGVFIALALVSLVALLLQRYRPLRWVLILVYLLLGLLGSVIALRHIYIKFNPEAASCGMDVETLLDFFPLQQALTQMFLGSADCAQAANFFWLPLPVWSLAGYLLFVGLATYSLCKRQ
ncbi:disulfide bond formation protein B [Marinospirillum perlucidum]|uniref:disulfide bond formation protein B n=1 Tax=Marinospirillum perlucidum TaxID=1982602 RepID=UPI000DF32261|nr:disulfide bond formation protein B [Marinospirillum perlucidum]